MGSCKIGSANQAVTDVYLREQVREGLRAVDAFVMPTITSGKTNSPIIMMAEKASDTIHADHRSSTSPRSSTLKSNPPIERLLAGGPAFHIVLQQAIRLVVS